MINTPLARPKRGIEDVPLLLVTGTVGVGKTSVAAEISDILSAKQIPHAFIDWDALSYSWPPRGRFNEDLVFKNLKACWMNFHEAGARRLVVSCVIESKEDLDRYTQAIPSARIQVCRLTASLKTREARLRAREVSTGLSWHLARTVELEQILIQASVEDFRVENESLPLQVVAREVLKRAGWDGK